MSDDGGGFYDNVAVCQYLNAPTKMKTKIQVLLDQLNHGLVERKDTLKTVLLAVLAGENVVLIGPPGTGKSLIARRIAESFQGDAGYFEYLLTKFSTPEEIFGPLSITALKADRFERNTAGYLPTVNLAFLDEIFKASSSILNALLTILNERVYHNGAQAQQVPLRALIAASNELPVGQDELGALYDRFMLRVFVDYVSRDKLALLFEKNGPMPALSKLDDDDLHHIRQAAESVAIPPAIVEAVQRIWVKHGVMFKEDRRESLSDRRLKKAIKILCVSAASNGRGEVDLSDVLLLKDCLWNHQENAVKVAELIMDTLRAFSRTVPSSGEAAEAAPAAKKTGAAVKGLLGSGTREDPLLIGSVHDLAGLERVTVGKKGYYFRQTCDIDCSDVSSWMSIPFKGHYDGDGHAVIYKRDGGEVAALFSAIEPQSSIANLALENLRLAVEAEGCQIARCKSNIGLIAEQARGCDISDCIVTVDLDYEARRMLFAIYGNNYYELGGIARYLSDDCTVERCFVSGAVRKSGDMETRFSGIAPACSDGSIRQCAVGKLTLSGDGLKWGARIASHQGAGMLENNVALDSQSARKDGNGNDGKSVAPALFKQAYFEHNLDWDFDTVWQWDGQHDRPALRACAPAPVQASSGGAMTDLLTQQIRANIWL